MISRNALPWQLILADLALILFLVAIAGLVGIRTREMENNSAEMLAIAPAQSLFRPSEGTPDINAWLANQELDPRATLTIFAHYETSDKEHSWREAQRLAELAKSMDVPVRVVLTPAQDTDIYASLAFDTPM